MRLIDATSFPKQINIPNIAKEKVTVLTNCILTEDEVICFNAAIKAVCEYIENENIPLEDYFAFNVIFSANGSFSFEEDAINTLGNQLQLAIYGY